MKDLSVKTPGAFRQYRILVAKDFRQEFQSFDLLSCMGIYAVLVLVVFGACLAAASSAADIVAVSGGLLWTLIVFTSLMGLARSFAREKECSALEGLLLAPLDRGVLFLAKASSNVCFLFMVEAVIIPLFWFFFLSEVELSASAAALFIPLFLGTLGMAAIGTLLSTISVNTRAKEVILAVLFVPLSFPLLWACASASTAVLLGGQAGAEVLFTSSVISAGYDIIMLVLGWVLYDFVVSV